MKGDRDDDPTLVIQAVDKLGRPVSEELLDAAHRNWKRVVVYAQQQGQDGAIAAGVLEATIHWLSAHSDEAKLRFPLTFSKGLGRGQR